MTSTVSSPERLHGLDALRGGALLLGVVLHAAMAYLPAPVWIATDASTSPVAAVLFFAIHVFRMATFFLIAGLFGQMMLDRRGWFGFAKDRLSRIAGPLTAFWGLVFPAIIVVALWKVAIDNGGSLPKDGPPPPPLTAGTFPLTHLWFLYVLLFFYAAQLMVRGLASLDRSGAMGRLADRVAGLVASPWSPVVLAAPLAVALWMTPNWIAFFGVPTPDTGLMPKPAALVAFGVAFAAGALLNHRRELLGRIQRAWAPLTVAALAAGTAALMLAGGPEIRLQPVEGQAKALAAGVYALAVYFSGFAAVALALTFASGHSAVRRYLADASYWVYIVHLPLVMAGQVWLFQTPWPWFAKLPLIVAGVMAISLLSYELLIRHTFMGKWLNGRRVPWRKPSTAPVAIPAE